MGGWVGGCGKGDGGAFTRTQGQESGHGLWAVL